jgi:acetyl esterase/lipase
MTKHVVGLILAIVLATAGSSASRGERLVEGVIYSRHGLALDLHLPRSPGPHPLVVVVHGGFWQFGDRRQFAPFCPWFTRRGYAVACIDYRLAPQNRFPAPLDDVKEALRFLASSASRYSLDPDRVALLGISAGAQLAALAALDGAPVRAVVDLYGPMDLTVPDYASDYTVEQVFGQGAALRASSPIYRIHGPCPPFFIVQGDKDNVVPPSQSEAFHKRLLASGNSSFLLLVANAGHDLMPIGGSVDPPLPDVAGRILAFLDRTLPRLKSN